MCTPINHYEINMILIHFYCLCKTTSLMARIGTSCTRSASNFGPHVLCMKRTRHVCAYARTHITSIPYLMGAQKTSTSHAGELIITRYQVALLLGERESDAVCVLCMCVPQYIRHMSAKASSCIEDVCSDAKTRHQ
jgi:hypothetical protein